MRLSSDDSAQRPQSQRDSVTDTPTVPMPAIYSGLQKAPTTDQLPDNAGPMTGDLPEISPRVTRKLVQGDPAQTTRLLIIKQPRTSRLLSPNTTKPLTLIPATEKRRRKISSTPPQLRRHSIKHIRVLVICVIMLILPMIFVTPLGIGQHQEGITRTIQQILSQDPFSPFSPMQQPVTPTPTPALLTSEGSCNQPSMGLWGTCATAITDSGVMGTGTMQRPIVGSTITQVFANPEYQSWCNCVRPHTGIDLAAPYETPITAADDGQVIWTGWDWSGLGWAVKINHGNYIATVYGHLARFVVKSGENITKGQVIAYEGSTGASTGPHLHFMVVVNNRWVDPTLYMTLP